MENVKKNNPLYEQIYQNLKDSILTGEIQPGERVVDAWIAEKLNVSRSPVREAFRKLEQDGLLQNQDGTTHVYNANAEDVVELFQIRAGLEAQAVFLATQQMNDQDIEEIGMSLELVYEAIQNNEFEKVIELNTYFHEKIIQLTNNKRLLEMMSKINTLSLLYRNSFFSLNNVNSHFYEEHIEIWKSMKIRDAEGASQKMRNHILNDLDELKDKLFSQPDKNEKDISK